MPLDKQTNQHSLEWVYSKIYRNLVNIYFVVFQTGYESNKPSMISLRK